MTLGVPLVSSASAHSPNNRTRSLALRLIDRFWLVRAECERKRRIIRGRRGRADVIFEQKGSADAVKVIAVFEAGRMPYRARPQKLMLQEWIHYTSASVARILESSRSSPTFEIVRRHQHLECNLRLNPFSKIGHVVLGCRVLVLDLESEVFEHLSDDDAPVRNLAAVGRGLHELSCRRGNEPRDGSAKVSSDRAPRPPGSDHNPGRTIGIKTTLEHSTGGGDLALDDEGEAVSRENAYPLAGSNLDKGRQSLEVSKTKSEGFQPAEAYSQLHQTLFGGGDGGRGCGRPRRGRMALRRSERESSPPGQLAAGGCAADELVLTLASHWHSLDL